MLVRSKKTFLTYSLYLQRKDTKIISVEVVVYVLLTVTSTIINKSLGSLLHFWDVFQFTQVQLLPSAHKQCWTRVSRIFSVFQLCIGWGSKNCKKTSKKEGTEKWQKNMNIAVLSQGLLSRIVCESWFWEESPFSSFFLSFLGILETSRCSHAIRMTFETIFST